MNRRRNRKRYDDWAAYEEDTPSVGTAAHEEVTPSVSAQPSRLRGIFWRRTAGIVGFLVWAFVFFAARFVEPSLAESATALYLVAGIVGTVVWGRASRHGKASAYLKGTALTLVSTGGSLFIA